MATAATHGHDHGVSADSDRRWLWTALALILAYMAAEVAVGLVAGSLALISDAGHMLTDAAAIGLALVAMRLAARPARGRYTFGFKRVEILSAQANGITLFVLAAWFVIEAAHRLLDPPAVDGRYVFVTALVGVVVNLAATWALSKANRTSLNVAGAFSHILNDLFAFVATAVAGLVVWVGGFPRADAVAALVVAFLMARAGWGLLRDSGRVFLEAAPADLDPQRIGAEIVESSCVTEVHDLHVWEITSNQPALSAHVLVVPGADCHAVRERLAGMLRERHGIAHTTLQLDHHSSGHGGVAAGGSRDEHCREAHGSVFLDPQRREG